MRGVFYVLRYYIFPSFLGGTKFWRQRIPVYPLPFLYMGIEVYTFHRCGSFSQLCSAVRFFIIAVLYMGWSVLSWINYITIRPLYLSFDIPIVFSRTHCHFQPPSFAERD